MLEQFSNTSHLFWLSPIFPSSPLKERGDTTPPIPWGPSQLPLFSYIFSYTPVGPTFYMGIGGDILGYWCNISHNKSRKVVLDYPNTILLGELYWGTAGDARSLFFGRTSLDDRRYFYFYACQYIWPTGRPGTARHGPVLARPDSQQAGTAHRASWAVPHRPTGLAFGPGMALWAYFRVGPVGEARPESRAVPARGLLPFAFTISQTDNSSQFHNSYIHS